MKKKKNRIPLIIVILLGSISFWLIINNKKGTIKETLRDFAVEDTASITKIFLADKNNKSITLERQPSGIWMLNGKFIARKDAVQTLLYTIKKVYVKEPVGRKAQDNIIKRLSGSSVKCEIYKGNELIKAYYVGMETQDQTGTYMILIDPETMKPSAKPFVTYIPGFEGYLTTRYFTDEKGWRDISVFKYHPDNIKSIKLETPYNPQYGYEVTVNGNNDYHVTLADHKPLSNVDTLAVKQYLTYFQNLNFEAFEDQLTEQQMDSVRNSKPINILTLTDKDGKISSVKFFARYPKHRGEKDVNGEEIQFDQERMDAQLNGSKDLVIVQYYVFGKAMPPAGYFQKRK
ncbi:MAG TPA: DUF4340 domain-containing protein [Bacteroidia bacterium]|nr:DUF4340 domain-containing protein [Bacteroidia bacterium]